MKLDGRALNRALLARQMLLERRRDTHIADAVEHLVGLQAQAITPPYYGLWSRLDGFDPHALGRLLTDRKVVRLTLMRGTVHLVTVDDALLLRPLVQPVIERGFNGNFRRRIADVDPDALAQGTRTILGEAGALTGREIAKHLIERGVGTDLEAIGNAVRVYTPLVQVTPRGVWGRSGQAKYATIEAWTGREMGHEPDRDAVILRYLEAFGPASVKDAQTWSGMTKLRDAFERLRPRLVTFTAEDGTELFDLPNAPRPDPGIPAPPRLLGEFDNVLLSHADRSRIISTQMSPWMDPTTGSRHVNNLLVDGMLRGSWWLERGGPLVIRTVARLTRAERDDVEAEAHQLLEQLAADAGGVRFEDAQAQA
jgi:Winged helix DNA-binding domain